MTDLVTKTVNYGRCGLFFFTVGDKNKGYRSRAGPTTQEICDALAVLQGTPSETRCCLSFGCPTGGAPADSLILCMLKCLPGARVSGDGTLHASAQHLLENFMRFAAAEPPPYQALS